MPETTKVPLGASTGARKYYLDVDVSETDTAEWAPILGITDFTPNFDDATLQDDSDYDSGGYGSQTKTGASWSASGTVVRKVTAADGTAYDPGQEFLRSKAIGQFGVANSVNVRIYEMEPGGPREEAYTGLAGVQWAQQGGSQTDLSTVQFTLFGQGALAAIEHPDAEVAAIAITSSASPATGPAAGGTSVLITGIRFTGTTGAAGVKFGATNAASYTVVDDYTIVAQSPAHAAGTVEVVVTNAVGASTDNADFLYV